MKPLLEYYKVQWLSFSRYIQSFPVLFRIIGILFLGFACFLLYKIEIEDTDFKLIGLVLIIYTILALNFSFKKAKRIFLHNYSVPVRRVLFIQFTLYSLPFFLIDYKIGCLCLVIGVVIALLKPDKISVGNQLLKFKPTYIFKKESFQWHSFYRLAGIYIHCLGILGIVMGIIHNNLNLSIVAFLLVGVVVGVGSILPMESAFFVKTYHSPLKLIQKKTLETLYNILVLQLPLAIVLLISGVTLWNTGYSIFATIVLAWITFAVKYSRYPDEKLTHFILFLVALPLVILCLVTTPWMLLGILLIVVAATYFMWKNLQRIFYQPDK